MEIQSKKAEAAISCFKKLDFFFFLFTKQEWTIVINENFNMTILLSSPSFLSTYETFFRLPPSSFTQEINGRIEWIRWPYEKLVGAHIPLHCRCSWWRQRGGILLPKWGWSKSNWPFWMRKTGSWARGHGQEEGEVLQTRVLSSPSLLFISRFFFF